VTFSQLFCRANRKCNNKTQNNNKQLANQRNKKMKCNLWTLGLAALGVVSLASVARADATNSLMTAVSSTTISGYVDTSVQWNLGTGNAHSPAYTFGGPAKTDGFNLNVVDLNLEKDPDATDGWGSGYRVELWLGPDADTLATQFGAKGDLAVKNAYVDLKAPLGNGLDIKMGVFDTPIGYEVADSPNNPNFTRSYGFTIEPTTHTGVLLGYTVNDMISLTAGIANTFGPGINARNATSTPGNVNESYKAYMGSVTFTAPTNWGAVSGSTITGCIINGFNAGGVGSGPAGTPGVDQTSYYVGASVNTPIKELKVGVSYDYVDIGKQPLTQVGLNRNSGYQNATGLFATYQLSEKLSLNARGEYFSQSKFAAGFGAPSKALEGTLTAQYDLWKNVLSRAEVRWDHGSNGQFFGGNVAGTPTRRNSVLFAANVVYKF
jgi:predicted porin